MTLPDRYLIKKIIVLAALTGLLAACAPPATIPQQSSNLTLEMRRLQSTLDRQEQSIQDLNRQLTELQDRQQRQALEIEQLRQTPQSVQTGYVPATMPQTEGSLATAVQGEGSPTEVYLQAFGDYASGRYQSAISGFESFLLRFPNNSYASNAQFWLGDCYFNQQQYPAAIQEFNRVISEYQEAPKSPEALYKIAIANLQLGASEEARSAIDILNQQYPKSSATQKAQELVIP
jgi:tol-pal system protein YbgF